MSESLVRLAWALPLVLMLGVGAAWLLRRGMGRLGALPVDAAPMTRVHSLALSGQTQAHLLAIGSRSVLVVETASGAVVRELHDVPASPRPLQRGWGGIR